MKKLLLILLSAITFQGFAQKGLPDIDIKDMNGQKVNMAEVCLSGKMTVVSFWATWCGPCKKELNNMAELYDEWKEKYNVEIIAVSIDDARNAAKVKSYANGQGWEFKVLLDENQQLQRALNFQTVPYTLLVSPTGEIIYQHSGYLEGDEYTLEEKIKGCSVKK